MTPLLAYQLGILMILTLLFLNAVNGLRAFERLSSYRTGRRANAPLISILVPARNEARTIHECVRSLLAQDYDNFEVLVLDDNSDDHTPILVAALAEHDLKLRLLRGRPIPAGWTSKAWACHQLAQQAQGEYLLFTEADTVHRPEVLTAALNALQWTEVDLLSVWPQQVAVNWIERLVLPLQQFGLFCFMPIRFVAGRAEPSVVAANGRFLFIRHMAYDRIGGHAAVRRDLAEEVALARRLRAFGGRLSVIDGTGMIRVHSPEPHALWHALSKSLFAPLSYSLPFVGAVVAVFVALFVLPAGFLLSGTFNQQFTLAWFWLPLYQVVLIVATRALVARRFGFPVWDALLHPLSVLLLFAIATDAVRWHLFELGGIHWWHPRDAAAPHGSGSYNSRMKKQRDTRGR